MKKNLILIISILLITLNSCETIVNIDTPPQLEITVLDIDGNSVQEANVSLFETESDWKNKTNQLFTKKTNNNGIVLFENLESKIYYFYVEKLNMNNIESIAVIDKELQTNIKAKIKTIIK